MNQAKKKHTPDSEPFTLSLYYAPSLETWEEYTQRCTDIANYAAQHRPLSSQSTDIDLSDTTKFQKVNESVYELITPSQEVQRDNYKKERSVVPIKPEERDIPGIIRVLKANIKAQHAAFVPDTAFTKGEMAFLLEILEHYLSQEQE